MEYIINYLNPPRSKEEQIKEEFKQQKRQLNKTKRQLNLEINKLERKEDLEIKRLKQYSKNSECNSIIRTKAKEIVHIRKQKSRCFRTTTFIEKSLSVLQTVQANMQTAETFKKIAYALYMINKMESHGEFNKIL